MKKQTKVLLAAAMMTIGASFTAMAATYDWQIEDGQWVCYDEEGDVYEDEWCESAGKEYWVGDEGVLVTSSWTDDGYYVDSTGAKTINAWKYILPVDADEDDAQWFYFGSKGKVTTGKKVIGEKTYYFDKDGIMLTGWVDYVGKEASEATVMTANTVFVGEDGARLANAWVEEYAPEVDSEDEDAEMNWFYIGSKGAAKTGRALDINGETYFFAEDGKMLSGWVAETATEGVYTSANAALSNYTNVYYCGDSDQGWAKKSTWINEYRSTVASADDDIDDMYWFWVDAKGKVLKATTAENKATEKYFADGVDTVAPVATVSNATTTLGVTKEINGKDYIFNQNGEMLSGLVEYKGNLFYYGEAEDGSMKTGAIELEDDAEEEAYQFYFAKSKDNDYKAVGAAVTGAASGDLYINGLLQTHDDDYKKVELTIGTTKYFFVIDGDGDIKTSVKEYKNDETVVATITTTDEFGSKGAAKGGVKVK